MLLIESMLLKSGGPPAIPPDNFLATWGANSNGELGFQIGVSWTSLTGTWFATQNSQGFGITSDSRLWSWGNGRYGALGLGNQLAYSVPQAVGTSSWTMVAAGTFSTVAIRSDGTLWSWGRAYNGQLGLNDAVTQRSSPTQVGTSSWVFVTAALENVAAIRSGGTLFTWGRNQGTLPTNDTLNRSSPTQIGSNSWTAVAFTRYGGFAISNLGNLWGWGVPSATNLFLTQAVSWTMVAQGRQHTLGIDSLGRLYAWGNGFGGALGLGSTLTVDVPTQVSASSWIAVSAGDLSSLAVRQGGTLFAWGNNPSGQLGDNTTINRSSPVQIGTSSWTQVTAGFNVSFAIDVNSKLWSWGNNRYGRLGHPVSVVGGTLNNLSSPVQVGSQSWTQIRSQWNSHTLGIDSAGLLYAWGLGHYGQTTHKVSQLWKFIGGGFQVSAGIDTADKLWMWGNNNGGWLGQSSLVTTEEPLQVGNSNWTMVAPSAVYGTFAIRQDGTLWCWGNGYLSSTLIPGIAASDVSWVALASNNNTAGQGGCTAIDSLGRLWAWGQNYNGQLGLGFRGTDGAPSTPLIPPRQVGTSSWTAVAMSRSFTVAIRSGGTLFAWGRGLFGQIGNGATIDRSSPVQIGSSSWVAVGSAGDAAFAIRSGGTLFAWGNNQYGRLGDGTNIARSSPVQIGTSSWTAVAGAGGTAFAIRNGGTLFAWGTDQEGVAGLGAGASRSSPTQVGSSSWTQVSAGYTRVSAAIRSDGALFVWGNNQSGPLGLNDTVYRSSPTQVGTSSWVTVGVGQQMISAIRSGGTLYTWGLGNEARLGLGDTISRSSPTQVGSNSWSVLTSKLSYGNLAVDSTGKLYNWGFSQASVVKTTVGTAGFSSPVLVPGFAIRTSSPVQIGTSTWTSISVNRLAAAVRSDGALFVWGPPSQGQLGNGRSIGPWAMSPTQLSSLSWTAVRAGKQFVLGTSSTGQLWAWGYNTNGELGDNTRISRSSPVQIGTSSWTAIANNVNHAMAIRQGGTLFTWGAGGQGRLGTGVTPRSSPTQVGTSSWTAIAAQYSRSTAIRADGTLWVFGGRPVGDGSFLDITSPILLAGASWTALNTVNSFNSAFAIRSDGTLYGWGDQSLFPPHSTLGLGQLSPVFLMTEIGTSLRSSPTQVGTSSWSAIHTTNFNSMAIRSDGRLFTWGRNFYGLLANGLPWNATNFQHLSSPTQIGTSSWIAVGGSFISGRAIRQDNTLWSWGNNFTGQLGLNTGGSIPPRDRSSPTQIGNLPGASWAALPRGAGGGFLPSDFWIQDFTGALDSNSLLWVWGVQSGGFLGIPGNTPTYRSSPTFQGSQPQPRSSPIQIGTSSWTAVSANTTNAAAIRADGSIFTWGNNQWGQLGNGANIDRSSPVQIGTSSWTAISAGVKAMAARRQDGTLWTWGNNFFGQLGDGTTIAKSSPVQVGTRSWSQIFAGNYQTFAVDNTSQGWAWGNNRNGSLGVNSLQNQFNSPTAVALFGSLVSSPTQIGSLSWTQVSAGRSHFLAVRSDRLAFAWGLNSNGQLGLGDTTSRSAPAQVGSSSWTQVAAGGSHSAFLSILNKVWTVGANDSGQLGIGPVSQQNSLQEVGLTLSRSFLAIQAGERHTLGIINDAGVGQQNKIMIWGNNFFGQLGMDDTLNRSSPVLMGNGSWSAISSTANTCIAIQTNSTLWAWGRNNRGQLGLNDFPAVFDRSSPVQVGNSLWWTAVAAGLYHCLAINNTNKLWAWGNNKYGQLGLNDVTGRSSPTQVGTSSWTAISAGGYHSLAVSSADRVLFTWGNNKYGQLGDSGFVDRSSPTQIGSRSWYAVTAGRLTSGGLFDN